MGRRARAVARVSAAALATRLLAGCVEAHVNGGPTLLTHTSGIVAAGGRASVGAGIASPPDWAYGNPVTFAVAADVATGRALCSVTGGAEVRTHPRPWGARVGVHGGILGWCDSPELNYQVVATGSLLRVLTSEEGGSEGTTWSFSGSLDLLVGGTWGDEIAPGLLVGVGVSGAFDWMKGYRFLMSIR